MLATESLLPRHGGRRSFRALSSSQGRGDAGSDLASKRSVYASICPVYLFIYLPIYLAIYLSIYLSV